MPKHPGPTVDLDQAVLQLIRLLVLYSRQSHTLYPLSIQARDIAKALLGIRSDQTKNKEMYWIFPDNLPLYLSECGIDPNSGYCLDRPKFNQAMTDYFAKRNAHLEEFYRDQDLDARKAGLKKALQSYRPSAPPKTASPATILANDLLNRRLAQHIRQSADDL